MDTANFEDSRSPREDRIVPGSSYIGHLYDKAKMPPKLSLKLKKLLAVVPDEGFLKPISDKYKLSYEYVF